LGKMRNPHFAFCIGNLALNINSITTVLSSPGWKHTLMSDSVRFYSQTP